MIHLGHGHSCTDIVDLYLHGEKDNQDLKTASIKEFCINKVMTFFVHRFFSLLVRFFSSFF